MNAPQLLSKTLTWLSDTQVKTQVDTQVYREYLLLAIIILVVLLMCVLFMVLFLGRFRDEKRRVRTNENMLKEQGKESCQ